MSSYQTRVQQALDELSSGKVVDYDEVSNIVDKFIEAIDEIVIRTSGDYKCLDLSTKDNNDLIFSMEPLEFVSIDEVSYDILNTLFTVMTKTLRKIKKIQDDELAEMSYLRNFRIISNDSFFKAMDGKFTFDDIYVLGKSVKIGMLKEVFNMN